MTFSKALTLPAEQVDSIPNGSPMQVVDISLIQEGNRIRALSHDQDEALKASIAEVGLLNPITVFRRSIPTGDEVVDGFGIVAGAHRLAACRDLGHTEIPVINKAGAYALSAARMAQRFLEVKQHGDNGTAGVLVPGHRFLAASQAYVEELQEARDASGKTDVLADLTEEEVAILLEVRSGIDNLSKDWASSVRRSPTPRAAIDATEHSERDH